MDVRNVLQRLDIFGEPLPSFNVRGHETVNSVFGGICSVIIFTIVLLYGVTKFIDLESRSNPNVSFFINEDNFGQGEQINLNERGFRIAFAVEGVYS